MTTLALSFRATESLWSKLFGRRRAAWPEDPKAIKRRAMVDLVDLPYYLKRDIGLFDD